MRLQPGQYVPLQRLRAGQALGSHGIGDEIARVVRQVALLGQRIQHDDLGRCDAHAGGEGLDRRPER